MKTSEKLNLHQKMLEVYKKVTTVVKDKTIKPSQDSNASYDVVTHDMVTRALHLPMAEAGLLPIPTQKSCAVSTFEKIKYYQGNEQKSLWYRADVSAIVKIVNVDDPAQFETYEASAYAFDTSDKAVGKAYSMAIKMIYLKAFMLESIDDEEEREMERAEQYQKQESKPVTKPSAPPQKAQSNNDKVNSYAISLGFPELEFKMAVVEYFQKPVESFDSLTAKQCEDFCKFLKTKKEKNK